MTESDAKQKWCPMFQGWKSNHEDTEHYKCKGSACMMWRWHFETYRVGFTEYVGKGYCGLAGKP